MWRAMLEAYGIDHEKLWDDITAYLEQRNRQRLDDATRDVIDALNGVTRAIQWGMIF